MGGKAVPQHVWSKILPKPGFATVLAEDFPENDAIHFVAVPVDKYILGRTFAKDLWPRGPQIFLHNGQRLPSNGHLPLLISLSHAAQATSIHLDVGQAQTAKLCHAQ